MENNKKCVKCRTCDVIEYHHYGQNHGFVPVTEEQDKVGDWNEVLEAMRKNNIEMTVKPIYRTVVSEEAPKECKCPRKAHFDYHFEKKNCNCPMNHNATPTTDWREKEREAFVKRFLSLFQDEKLYDVTIRREGETGVIPLVLNDQIQKRALYKANKVADYLISRIEAARGICCHHSGGSAQTCIEYHTEAFANGKHFAKDMYFNGWLPDAIAEERSRIKGIVEEAKSKWLRCGATCVCCDLAEPILQDVLTKLEPDK